MNKTVLITGASGGIGFEFTKIFARKQYNLVLVARSKGKLLRIKKVIEEKYGVKVMVIEKDLAKKDAALDIFNKVTKEGIAVDILINNAGFGDFSEFSHSNWKKQYDMIQVNIVAMMQMTKCFLSPMLQRKQGKILNMASTAAFQPGPFLSNYYAGKAFVLSFTEAVAMEIKNTGVTIMALCPGPTRTGFVDRADLGKSKLFKTLKVANAKDVAEYGYRKLMQNKVVAIHGKQNKMLQGLTKISPRALVRIFMYHLQEKG